MNRKLVDKAHSTPAEPTGQVDLRQFRTRRRIAGLGLLRYDPRRTTRRLSRSKVSLRPITCFVAARNAQLIAFAAYDATVLGVLGPMGWMNRARAKVRVVPCSLPPCLT